MIRMFNSISLLLGLLAIMASGCCGPMGGGLGCGNVSCNDCDGSYRAPLANGPIAAARNLRRGLVCGSGCGETYVGEWSSTPPNCQDPCCGSDFVGGAFAARPFCRTGCRPQPLKALYGKRFCSGNESSVPCGFGGLSCEECSAGTCSAPMEVEAEAEAEAVEEASSETAHQAGPVSGGCGCVACRSPQSPMATRLAQMGNRPHGQAITARAEQIRK